MSSINITFSTCLYQLKNRHGKSLHIEWMRGFIQIVKRFYLVIYTDHETSLIIHDEMNKIQNKAIKSNIKVVIKPYTEFYNNKYADFWKRNNENPNCKLYDTTDWRLNMLWCEKVHFVHQTMTGNYFDRATEYYGWCDIGYFRDTLAKSTSDYANIIREHWPNTEKINRLNKNLVYYGCNVKPDHIKFALKYHFQYFDPSKTNAVADIPSEVYNKKAHFISGGFFITSREKMKWWIDTFQTALEKHMEQNAVIQDDQQIISYCVFKNYMSATSDQDHKVHYCIMKVNETQPDKLWFMFRDILL